MDEGVISSLIEMGDTWFDITTMGNGTALKGLLKNGVKNPKAAKLLTLLGKYGLNIGGEGLEESLQQGVSIANRNRQGAGAFDLAEKTAGTVWDAVTGKDPAAWQEMWAAAKEGGKVAALFGGAEMAGHTMVASGLTNGTLGEHTVTKPRDWLIAEGEAQLRSRKMPDDAHLEAMEVSEPEARGIMSIMAMEALENKDQPYYVVTQIGRSLGAKAKNYKAYNPISGEQMPLTEGTRIVQPKNHIIAGNGRNRQIDELQLLLDTYGGDPLKWTKEKGFGYVDDEYGESHYVELHWYQEPHTGRVKMKIKVQSDGRIYLDDE